MNQIYPAPPPPTGGQQSSQSYAVIDIYYFLKDIAESKWIIAKWIAVFTLLSLMIAVRPSPPTMQSTVRIDPEEMRGLVSAGLLNIDSEIGIIESWSTVTEALENLNYYALSRPQTTHKPLQRLLSKPKHSDQPEAWVAFDALHMPPNMLGQSYRLVIAKREEDHDFQLETIDPLNARILLRGTVGTTYRLGAEQGSDEHIMRINEIHAPAGTRFTVTPKSKEAMIEYVYKQLNVSKRSTQPGSSLIDLEISTYDQAFGLKLLNEVARLYIDHSYGRLTASKKSALKQLEGDVKALKATLEKEEAALEAFLLKTGVINPVDLENNLLDRKLEIEMRLSEAYTKRQKNQLIYTEKHPSLIAVNEEIAQLESELADIVAAREAIPYVQNRLQQLGRNVKMAADIYESMVDKYTALQVDIGGIVNTVTLINPARIILTNPLKRMVQIVVLGGMLGMIIAFTVVLLRASMRHSMVESTNQLASMSTIPVSRQVIKLKKGERAYTMTRNSADSLREQFPYLMLQQTSSVIALVAPRNYAITASLALDIAKTSAPTGKTLLIDAFVRYSPMHEVIDRRDDVGLSDVLAGKTTLQSAVREIRGTGLDFMPAGTNMISFQILEDYERFFALIETLKPHYKHIFLHVPDPLLLPNAPQFLSRCDHMFHLIRFGLQIDKLQPHLEVSQQVTGTKHLILPFMLRQENKTHSIFKTQKADTAQTKRFVG